MAVAFSWDPRPEEKEIWLGRAEFDRYLGAFDAEEMVGTSGSLTCEMVVPGGAVIPFGGITAVSVNPTHRRRGVLTMMMRRLLDDTRAHGESIAALWAAESSIYGRYGFGAAIEGGALALDRSHAVLRDQTPPSGRVRIMASEEARSLIPEIYSRATAAIPGTILRNEADWRIYFFDPEHWREGATSARYAVYESGGEARGFACFRAKENWGGDIPGHELQIDDLQAVDADAYRSLYRFCFGIDLVKTIKVRNRRAHEPILHLLVDPRRCQRTPLDRIWVRIVDVASALSLRRYAAEGEIVLEIHDHMLPELGGRFLLRGGPDGADCARTDRAAEVAIDASDLAACYLGDSRLPQLAWLGRVSGDPRAIHLAHLMLQWPEQPWCTASF
jgi:predicted acetyltransferase